MDPALPRAQPRHRPGWRWLSSNTAVMPSTLGASCTTRPWTAAAGSWTGPHPPTSSSWAGSGLRVGWREAARMATTAATTEAAARGRRGTAHALALPHPPHGDEVCHDTQQCSAGSSALNNEEVG
ncbi:hypothetical protein HaLaN_28084, partial [Haematococcus lacustris]